MAEVAYVLGSPEKETMLLENNIINFNARIVKLS